jgi:hypothetical protein
LHPVVEPVVEILLDLASPVDLAEAEQEQVQVQPLLRHHFRDLLPLFLKEKQEHRVLQNRNGLVAVAVVRAEMELLALLETLQPRG